MSMLARRQLRLLAIAALKAETGIAVESPGDWAVPPSKLPSIRLRALGDRKMSIARTIPEFTTTVTLEILATVAGDTQEEAQDALELLGNTIEVAIFGSQKIVGLCQQFTTALTEVDINADGSSHIGRAKITIDCETFEAFDPALLNPATTPNLARIGIHLDLAAPFDATGTYVDPPFPGSVNPAPRTIGPDGRDEATLVIDIPT